MRSATHAHEKRRGSLLAAGLSLVTLLIASCVTTNTQRPTMPVDGDEGEDCPEAPPSMSRVEQLQAISRAAREARANLLVQERVEGQRVVATLHPPRLALAEAVLAAPRRARRRSPNWLARNLYVTRVDLQTRTPLVALERAPGSLALRDDRGQPAPLLSLERRKEKGGFRYLLAFAPPRRIEGRARYSLALPGNDEPVTLRWSLALANQARLDTLPLLFDLAPLRDQLRARWASLLGDTRRAKALLDELQSCDQTPALDALAKGLAAPAKVGAVRTFQIAGGEEEPGLSSPSATRPTRLSEELALRVAIAQRLAPAVGRGLLSSKVFTEALEALQAAAKAGDAKVALNRALDFDRALARALDAALRSGAPLASPSASPKLQLMGTPAPTAARVSEELQARIAAASQGLLPRWISARTQPTPGEVWPQLQAQIANATLFASSTRRLGRGYWHLGLPPQLRFSAHFHGRGASFWSRLAREATSPKALRALAERILARAQYGEAAVRGLALRGLVELRGAAAVSKLVPVDPSSPRAKEVVAALAASKDPRSLSHLRDLAKSDGKLRSAALWALLRRRDAAARDVLHGALQAAAPETRVLAAAALCELGDRRGVKALEAALRAPASEGVVHRLLRRWTPPKRALPGVRRALVAKLSGAKSPEPLLAALMSLDDRASRQRLARLYKRQASLRPLLLKLAAEHRHTALLLAASPEDPLPLALQRALVAALAATASKGGMTKLRGWLAKSKDELVRAAAQTGLARLSPGDGLLALGPLARGSCQQRALVVPVLVPSMDQKSRRRLLLEALGACPKQAPGLWRSVVTLQASDAELLRAGLGHRRATVRVQAALTVLGQRRGAVLGPAPSGGATSGM